MDVNKWVVKRHLKQVAPRHKKVLLCSYPFLVFTGIPVEVKFKRGIAYSCVTGLWSCLAEEPVSPQSPLWEHLSRILK